MFRQLAAHFGRSLPPKPPWEAQTFAAREGLPTKDLCTLQQ
jgi:hypothetical protein